MGLPYDQRAALQPAERALGSAWIARGSTAKAWAVNECAVRPISAQVPIALCNLVCVATLANKSNRGAKNARTTHIGAGAPI